MNICKIIPFLTICWQFQACSSPFIHRSLHCAAPFFLSERWPCPPVISVPLPYPATVTCYRTPPTLARMLQLFVVRVRPVSQKKIISRLVHCVPTVPLLRWWSVWWQSSARLSRARRKRASRRKSRKLMRRRKKLRGFAKLSNRSQNQRIFS